LLHQEEQVFTETTEIMEEVPSESYQLIQHEHLNMVVVSEQVLSGSKVSASSYKKVVFSDCIFYACDFKEIEFSDCVFENCTFEFSHFRKCKFKNCNFSNCTWKGVSSLDCIYEACDLGRELSDLCRNGRNTLTSGRRNQDYSTDIYIQLALAS
jgi:uncharacterized protein YjbI with pentapeptide repeats